MTDVEELRAVISWMAGYDTGLSSETIATAMVGLPMDRGWGPCAPGDPADLGRCLRLLAAFPHWTPERFAAKMSALSHEWRCFVEDWAVLAASMEAEVGIDWSKGSTAPATFDLMKATQRRAIETDPDIVIDSRRADGSPNSWTRTSRTTLVAEVRA